MDLREIQIIPLDPGIHFPAVAALLNTVESEPNTPESLAVWYNKELNDQIRFAVAVTPVGVVLGFYGLYHANTNLDVYFGMYPVVAGEVWGHWLGSLLYDHLMVKAAMLGVRTLRTMVRHNSENAAMTAIDTKLGYKHTPVTLFMEKCFEHA